MPRPHIARIALAILVVALLSGAAVVWIASTRTAGGGATSLPIATAAPIGGPFSLIDHEGRPVTDADYRGQLMLIYFGFTYCPDVCPTELASLANAVDLLGAPGEQVQPLFITIDPERDTPETMAGYVSLFHPRLVGLTGSPEQIAATAKEFKVFYGKVESEDFSDYLMDHSSFFYLMGPDGENLAVFGHGTAPEDMATAIRGYLSET